MLPLEPQASRLRCRYRSAIMQIFGFFLQVNPRNPKTKFLHFAAGLLLLLAIGLDIILLLLLPINYSIFMLGAQAFLFISYMLTTKYCQLHGCNDVWQQPSPI